MALAATERNRDTAQQLRVAPPQDIQPGAQRKQEKGHERQDRGQSTGRWLCRCSPRPPPEAGRSGGRRAGARCPPGRVGACACRPLPARRGSPRRRRWCRGRSRRPTRRRHRSPPSPKPEPRRRRTLAFSPLPMDAAMTCSHSVYSFISPGIFLMAARLSASECLSSIDSSSLQSRSTSSGLACASAGKASTASRKIGVMKCLSVIGVGRSGVGGPRAVNRDSGWLCRCLRGERAVRAMLFRARIVSPAARGRLASPSRPRPAPARPSARDIPSAHAPGVSASAASLAPAPRLRRRSGAACSAFSRFASARASPAGKVSPVVPSRTRPPAAAPTASLATTGVLWSIASLATRPHGSTKLGVRIDGSTSRSAAA